MRMCDTGETAYLAWLASTRIPADHLRELLIAYKTGKAVFHAACVPDDRLRDIVPEKTVSHLQHWTGQDA